MSDEIRLLNQARALRRVARDALSSMEKLSQAQHRQIVVACADRIDRLADELERLASVDAFALGAKPSAWTPESCTIASVAAARPDAGRAGQPLSDATNVIQLPAAAASERDPQDASTAKPS
jgi:hypothetical protein